MIIVITLIQRVELQGRGRHRSRAQRALKGRRERLLRPREAVYNIVQECHRRVPAIGLEERRDALDRRQVGAWALQIVKLWVGAPQRSERQWARGA